MGRQLAVHLGVQAHPAGQAEIVPAGLGEEQIKQMRPNPLGHGLERGRNMLIRTVYRIAPISTRLPEKTAQPDRHLGQPADNGL